MWISGRFYLSHQASFAHHNGNPEQVTTFSCDMSASFIAGTHKQFPQATMTFDKFHIVKVLSEAVDAVRREEQREHPELKRTRYVWLKNPVHLTAVAARFMCR